MCGNWAASFQGNKPPTPSARTSSVCPGLHGFAGVMRTAEALAIGSVEGGASIAELFDVIREQPMLRRSLGAAAPILNPLAPEASVEEYLLAPLFVLIGMVDGIRPLGFDADCSPVRLRHQGSERLDSRHCLLPLLVVMDRSGIILSVPAVGLAPVRSQCSAQNPAELPSFS